MLSKNNFKERLRKMEPRQDRFSIRKFSVGAASVLIGFLFIGMSNGEEVNADELTEPNNNDNGHPEQVGNNAVDANVPKKVVVNTPKTNNAADLTKSDQQVIKSGAVEEAQTQAAAKSQSSQKTQGQVSQPAKADTNVKPETQTQTKVDNQKANAAQKAVQKAAIKANDSVKAANALTGNNNGSQTVKISTDKQTGKATTDLTVDTDVATFQKEYTDLQNNFAKLGADERTQAASKVQADYEKLSTQAKAKLALANSIDQQLYSVNNGEADVSTFADFTKALCDKNVTTIKLMGDITASNNQKMLDSGGTGAAGIRNINSLYHYELSADQLIRSPYKNIAHTVTINGNGHILDMNKWTISLSNQNYGDNPWNITFENMTITANTATPKYGTFNFYFNALDTRKNLTAAHSAATHVNFNDVVIKSDADLITSPINVTFTGNNTITSSYKSAPISAANITVDPNATLNVNAGTTALKASGTITVGDGAKVHISANGQDMVATNVNIGNNAVVNLTDTENTSLNAIENNAITFTANMDVGDGTTININTGDAKPANGASTHDVRGIFGNTDTEASSANLHFRQNDHVNMDMGKGHSIAIMVDNMDVDEGTQIHINTQQNNNNQYTHGTPGNVKTTSPNPDGFHFAPITMAWDGSGELHLKKGALLQVVRNTQNDHTVTPIITFGSGGDGRLGALETNPRLYTLTVDGGASLDLQDDANSSPFTNYNWKSGHYLDSDYSTNISAPGMLAMFGTNSRDTLQFGSTDSNGNYVAPAYINLQRTGKQWGQLIKLEGKALKDIHNKTILYGQAPLAQWNGSNKTTTPDHAWTIKKLITQNAGGDTGNIFVPEDESKLLISSGFDNSDSAKGVALGKSNATVVMPDASSDSGDLTYSDPTGKAGVVTGNKQSLMKLQNMLDNFNWWKARRISYGTDLLKKDTAHGITINPSDIYTPTVAPQTYNEGKYENNDNDFANNKIVTGVSDASGNEISTGLDKIISSSKWGIDWSKTEFKNILNSDGAIDQNKLNALQNSKNKSESQVYDDKVEYDAYTSLISSLNNPDGSSGYDPTKTQFKLSDSTKDEQTYNIPITVTFTDGSANIALVPVTVKKAKQNTQYQPSYGTQTVEQGKTATVAAPSFKTSTENEDGTVTYADAKVAPTGVAYALTDGYTKPDFVTLNSDGSITLKPTTTDNTGVYSIPVTVTYSDKSADNISALVAVTDGKAQVIWGKKNPDGSVKGAVVVKPGAVTIHKTSGSSSSINNMDAKRGVSEIDVYSQNATDPTKLDNDAYSYSNGAYNDSKGNSLGGLQLSYNSDDPKVANFTTLQGDSTTLPIIVSFGTQSDPAQKGIIENGATTQVSEDVTFAGATALSTDKPINVPIGYNVSKDPEHYFSSDNLKNLIDHSALDNNISDPNFVVDNYSIVGTPDTSILGTPDLTIRINFKDKAGDQDTYLDVKIPKGVNVTSGDAGKYNPTYADTVDSTQSAVTVTPSFGNNKPADGDVVSYALGQTSEQNMPTAMQKYISVDSKTGTITIGQGAMGDTASYEIPVVVTYKDGTHDDVVANVYEIKGKDVTDPDFATDAISNFNKLPGGTTAKWATTPDPHKSSQQVPVIVTLPDGKPATVTVNVTNSNALKPNTTTIYGQDTTTTITIETPSYHKTTGDNFPKTAPRVSQVTIVSDKGTTTTYNLSSDGKTYVSTDGKNSFSADQIATVWEDGYKLNTNTSNFPTDGTNTTLHPTYPVSDGEKSDEWDATHNSKYRVNITLTGDAMTITGIPGGDAGWCNAYADIYGAKAAGASDANKQLKAVQNVPSSLADPSAYVDTNDLTAEHNSEVQNVTWNTKPDLSKAGENVSGSVDINFKDGTKLTIPVTITVAQSDANKFETDNTDKNPLTQTISVHKDSTVNAGDAIKGFSDDTKTKYNIVADGTQFNENVPTDTVGTNPYAATVKFADGSSTIVNIPVKVYTDKSNFDDANKDGVLTHEITEKMGSTVPDTDAKNGVKEDPTNTYHIIWTDNGNLKAPRFNDAGQIDTSTLTSDTNPEKSYEATIYFEDGTSTTVNIPVKIVASDASSFAQDNKDNALVQTISKGKGYQFKDTDAKAGVKEDPTNTYHIIWTDNGNLKAPRFDDVTKIDTSKETPSTPYDATIYFEDGTKLGVKIPVVITDEATDNQDNLKTKTYQVDQGGTVTADQVIDKDASKNIPEGTQYSWGDKTPDTSKVGTQDVTITATYPDGTKGTVDGKVTVEATPKTATVTLRQGVTPTADDATSSITNLVPAGQDGMPKSVIWKTTPSTTDAGKANATVTVTYNDGYTKDVTVPINVWKTTKGSEVTKPSADTHDIYREITRTVTVDGGTPQTQKLVFTRDRYTDTTDSTAKPTYSDWTAKDGKNTFAESDKLTKDGYTPKVDGTDVNGKPITLTDKGTIPAETVTADSQSENITVTNTANDQTVTVKFINAKDGSEVTVENPKTFSGKTDQSITIDKDQIPIPASYKLDKDSGLPATYKFTAASGQTITVKLDHLTTLDPTKVDRSQNSDMFETITRTINYTAPTNADAKTVTQSVEYQRTKTVNDSDKTDITYGDWTPVDSTNTAWGAYTVPTFEDYTVAAKDADGKDVTITNGQIASQTLEPGNGNKPKTADQTINLTYTMTNAGHFKKDNGTTNAQTQLIRVKKGTDKSTIDGKQGIKTSPDYTVQSVTFTAPFNIDTSVTSPIDKPFPTYGATVTFADGSTATVNIPIQVYDRATDFEQANQKTPLTQEVDEKKGATVPATDAVNGFTHDTIQKYGIVSTGDQAPKFNSPIDTSKVTETATDYEATINFDDGSSTTVKIPVKIIASDASAFDNGNKDNALVKQLTWGKGTSHEASEAIDGIQDQTTYHVTGATFTTVPSTATVHDAQNFAATVSFKDGTKTTVQIPVAITDNAGDDKTITKNPIIITVDPGTTPQTPDPKTGVKDPDAPQGTKYEWKGTPKVPEPGDQPAPATVVVKYPDGTQKEVPTTIVTDYNPSIDTITTPKDVAPSADKGISNLNKGKGYPTSVKWTKEPDVTKIGSTTGTATVSYDNGVTKDVTIPVNVVKNDSETYNPQATKDPVKTPQGTQVDPGSIVDKTTLPTDPKDKPTITWTDPKNVPDVSKPGTQPANVDVKYPDGTVSHVKGKVTVEATPETGSISTNQNVVPDLTNSDNAKKVVTNIKSSDDPTADGYPTSVKWTTNPDVSKAGKTTGNVTITYKDGYTVTKDVPINVIGVTDGKDPANKDQSDIYKDFTRTVTVDGGEPQVQHVILTRTRYTDTTQPAGQQNTYSDWISDNASFAEIDVSKPGYTASAQDDKGNTVALTTDGKVASETVSLKDADVENHPANEVINVSHTANDQSVTINYVDAKSNEKVGSQTITGKTDATAQVASALKIPDNYQLNADDKVPAAYTFKASGNNPITVKVDKINEVDPDPEHKTDPDQQDLFETITRTITYTDPTTGKQVTVNQGVDFKRSKKVNNTTGDVISYSNWALVDQDQNTWAEYTVPTFEDYTVSAKDDAGNSVDISTGKIASQTVNSSTKNTTITLTYSETDAGKFKDKNKDNSQIQTILVHQNADPSTVKASDGIKNLPENAIVAFNDGTTIDTKDLGTTSYPATITFADKSTAQVNIPVKVYNDASKFNEDNAKNPLTQTVNEKQGTQVDPTDAVKGFSSDTIKNYDIDTTTNVPVFTQTIDTSSVTTTPTDYDAAVYFKDGSHTSVKIPVQIVASDASQFNDAVKKDSTIVQGITVNRNTVVPATDAIKGIKDADTYHVTEATFDKDVDTSKAVSKVPYSATVTFEDGSSTSVQIPVTVVDTDASRFLDNVKTEVQTVEEMYKSTVPKTDALKGIKDPTSYNVTGASFDQTVDTSKDGVTKNYSATVTFKDGTTADVAIPVKIVSLADKFDDQADLKAVSRKVGQEVKPGDAMEGVVNATRDGVSSAVFDENVPTDTAGSNPYKATLTFTDGTTKDVDITVSVGDTDASTFNKADLKPLVKIPEGTKIDPTDKTNAKDALKDPSEVGGKITDIQYVKVPDTSKPTGVVDTPIKITFKDGSTTTVNEPVKITSDADNYTGTPQNIGIPHGSTIDPKDTNNAKGGATDPDKTIDHIQFNNPKEIDTSTVGNKQTVPATITFKDGSTKDIQVPITITKNDADKFNPDDLKPITVDKNSTINPGDQVPGAIDPDKKTEDDVTDITYVNVPDTTKSGTQNPTVKVSFNDGSSTNVQLPVTVSSDKKGNAYELGTKGENDSDNHYVYREIIVHHPDTGKQDIVTQVIHFIRKDKNGNSSYTVDDKTTYVPWTVADSDGNSTGTAVGHFKEYDAPTITDYTPDKPSVADEKVTGDAYADSPVPATRDQVEKIEISYSVDMKQVSFDYLAVPASFTPADSMILQLAAYDIKSGKQIKMPQGIDFVAKSLPQGVKLDEKTGNLIVPKGMKIGQSDAKVEAVALTGQKEVGAHLNVVGNGQNQGQTPRQPSSQNTGDNGQTTQTSPATEPTQSTPSQEPVDQTDTDDNSGDEDESAGISRTSSTRRKHAAKAKTMNYTRNSGLGAGNRFANNAGVNGESTTSSLAAIGPKGRADGDTLGTESGKNTRELPQTGEKDNSGLAALGMMAVDLSLIGLAGVKKRKHN